MDEQRRSRGRLLRQAVLLASLCAAVGTPLQARPLGLTLSVERGGRLLALDAGSDSVTIGYPEAGRLRTYSLAPDAQPALRSEVKLADEPVADIAVDDRSAYVLAANEVRMRPLTDGPEAVAPLSFGKGGSSAERISVLGPGVVAATSPYSTQITVVQPETGDGRNLILLSGAPAQIESVPQAERVFLSFSNEPAILMTPIWEFGEKSSGVVAGVPWQPPYVGTRSLANATRFPLAIAARATSDGVEVVAVDDNAQQVHILAYRPTGGDFLGAMRSFPVPLAPWTEQDGAPAPGVVAVALARDADLIMLWSRRDRLAVLVRMTPEKDVVTAKIKLPFAPDDAILSSDGSRAVFLGGDTLFVAESLAARFDDLDQRVVSLQERLRDDGAAPDIVLSGEYDAATRAGIVAFQRQKGLAADGIAGPRTRKALGLGW